MSGNWLHILSNREAGWSEKDLNWGK